VAGVLDLAAVLEWVVDGLSEKTLAEQPPIPQPPQPRLHVPSQERDQHQPCPQEEQLAAVYERVGGLELT
jgi:hypothetical protein